MSINVRLESLTYTKPESTRDLKRIWCAAEGTGGKMNA
jgi:hypothetical protein